MKKILAVFIALLIPLTLIFSINPKAAGASVGDVNVVFVIDSSRSMGKSDPELIRLEALKLFSDLCDLERTKIGFVLFADDIIYSQEPVEINTEADRKKLKQTISGLDERQGSTNIGRALNFAANMLAKEDDDEGTFMVFLSDGMTVISSDPTGMAESESQAELENAVKTAQENDFPIYTIGLDGSGQVDREALEFISSSTYALDPFIINNADDLSSILSQIYAQHTGAKVENVAEFVSTGDYHDVEFEIPDNSVVYANLIVMHEGGLDDIKLYDPSGKEAVFDNTSVVSSINDIYSHVKIYYPSKGNWKISIKSPKDVMVEVQLILSRDYTLDFDVVSHGAIGAGTKINLSAALLDLESNPVTDESVTSVLEGVAIIKDIDNAKTVEVPLTADKNTFRGEYTLEEDHSYTVQIGLSNKTTDIRTEIVKLAFGSEEFKAPEFPWMIILIIVGGLVLLVVIVIVAKKIADSTGIPIRSGRLSLNVTAQGTVKPPCNYDMARFAMGKKAITLYEVFASIYRPEESELIIPAAISKKIRITMSKTGDLRITKAGDLNFSGGLDTGKMIILSNRARLTIQFVNKTNNARNTVSIQYTMS